MKLLSVARLGLIAALGGVAAAGVIAAFQGTSSPLGPATVRVQPGIGRGDTILSVPPLGTVAASTHTPPLALRLLITEIDFAELQEAVRAAPSSEVLVSRMERDLRAAALKAAGVWLLLAAVAGALAGALWTPRRWSQIAAGAVGGFALLSAALVLTYTSFDVEAFREPRFSGSLERAPQVIEAAQRDLGSLDDLRSRYETLAERVSGLLSLAANPTADPRSLGVAVLHISDIHSNPLGLEIANQLARSFEVDAVLDTGDLTSFGLPIESEMRRLINQFSVPYIFVPGNHDSTANRSAIGSTRGVQLLDEATAELDDVTILGVADPTFTADSEIPTEEGNEIRSERAQGVSDLVAEVEPDVLAVHDVRLAEDSLGLVPLIVAGHTHEREASFEEGTTVLTVGSTGATGLGSFTAETGADYEAEILYLQGGELSAIDYIELHGLGDEFEIDREIFDEIVSPDGIP